MDLTLLLKVMLLLSMCRAFQCDLYTVVMNFQIAFPISSKSFTLLALSLLIDLPAMNFFILISDSLILSVSEARCSMDPCNEIAWKLPSQDSRSKA